eukprot:CAMPEP_0118644894 /NCGR_PEP_ID=MMETSP0785-20121206/7200_1 /TAXON_ID=91992 /ORGANISM="Bolidomonas pacifica, Strain CCMP 1866" /LENGTH=74 /DNA_ID=CAMNT_0006536719 /DNA_START=137 /DNA_END=357 /DNA_ORIENTATION=-
MRLAERNRKQPSTTSFADDVAEICIKKYKAVKAALNVEVDEEMVEGKLVHSKQTVLAGVVICRSSSSSSSSSSS